MRLTRELIPVGILLLVFIAGGLLLGGHQKSESRLVGEESFPDPSVYNDRASGSQGVFEWTRALGYRPAVWRRSWQYLDKSGAPVLLVIAPYVGDRLTNLTGIGRGAADAGHTDLQARDAVLLQDWVKAGHTAVLMCSSLSTGHWSTKHRSDSFGDALDLLVRQSDAYTRSEFAPSQPITETEGVCSIHLGWNTGKNPDSYDTGGSRIYRHALDGLALFEDMNGAAVLEIGMGKGRLIVIADSRFASNRNLCRSDNALFLAHILAGSAHAGDTVLFDEYHHGDAMDALGDNVWTALGEPLQLALIQLLIALFVVAGVVAIRFGAPVPLMRGMTRTSAEYVTSLAGLYQRAGAASMALETIYRQFLRDISARLALASDVSLEKLVETAARRGQVDRNELRNLLATCESRLDTDKISEMEMLSIVDRMERIRKDLGIG